MNKIATYNKCINIGFVELNLFVKHLVHFLLSLQIPHSTCILNLTFLL
jgi:hypothetical protein